MIEGFLDILLPEPDHTPGNSAIPLKPAHLSELRSAPLNSNAPAFEKHAAPKDRKDRSPKPLFTVKPGGIAGYLCKSATMPCRELNPLSCIFPSFVV